MNIKSIIAVIVVYAIAVAAWVILGTAMEIRSDASMSGLDQEVRSLWGAAIVQNGPLFTSVQKESEMSTEISLPIIVPTQTRIMVDISLEHRRKGLIWYPTYVCAFDSVYTITNDGKRERAITVRMPFPSSDATYDAFALQRDRQDINIPIDTQRGIHYTFSLAAGSQTQLSIRYITRGIESWSYQLNKKIGRVKDFKLLMTCNFKDYDYRGGAMSADHITETENGVELSWITKDRITQQYIGVEMPARVNPGPLSARMTFFAPVCLIFFFVLLAAISTVRRIHIHPMHYLFVACGFFAFHLLFAYLVDLLNVHISFAIATAATLFLVTSYLQTALCGAFPVIVAIAGQLFFLVLFSYSFFLNGTTGLVVAIGSVLTLAVIMRITAGVDWKEFFECGKKVR